MRASESSRINLLADFGLGVDAGMLSYLSASAFTVARPAFGVAVTGKAALDFALEHGPGFSLPPPLLQRRNA